ncbi:hypothetical protein HNQ60_003880 [Povalibacter uvarum]|uniref:Uncharacterized protein n=1 Tax=Povalibacter uvarum TaxID=732238 RepID=A0A841HQF7_9GAMM|nr:hypothetical protein [Povalibacter uvarum]
MTAAKTTSIPIACVPAAIPAGERRAHFALAERLFGELALGRLPLDDGYQFRFPATALSIVTKFLTNERLCCPFMRFALEIEPGTDAIVLRMTGPIGTREILDAELNLDHCKSTGCGCHVS